MARPITIDALWDDEAHVWTATSRDVPGLVIEADTWAGMVREVRLTLPDLLELSGDDPNVSLTFKAEERLDLAAH